MKKCTLASLRKAVNLKQGKIEEKSFHNVPIAFQELKKSAPATDTRFREGYNMLSCL
jgi:hypothetical protein